MRCALIAQIISHSGGAAIAPAPKAPFNACVRPRDALVPIVDMNLFAGLM